MADSEIRNKLIGVERSLKDLRQTRDDVNTQIRNLETEKADLERSLAIAIRKMKPPNTEEWATTTFDWSEKITEILRNQFKFETFRLKQLAAINATLSKKDVILVMPTGGGKSLVYQLPAMIDEHITIVVSPLISLIEDQLIALKKLGIRGASLNGSSSKTEKKQIHVEMVDHESTLKLVFVTPEWMANSKLFMKDLLTCFKRGWLSRIVIDEIHCCSTWGHDFRPDYNHLSFMKSMFPGVPILGLTATATTAVLADIQNMLGLEGALIITAPFNRPNLFYKVVQKPAEKSDCISYLAELLSETYENQSGIIYTTTVKEAEDVSDGLRSKGLKVRPYHAQLDSERRKRVHARWLDNTYQAVVATIAFGMGIDKPDVRFVIHYSVPKSLEGFYQESGRAGRDGNKADCVLLYDLGNFLRNVCMASSKTEEQKASLILEYCLNKTICRRYLIATHFEDAWSGDMCKQMCDCCVRTSDQNLTNYNVAPIYDDILKLIELADGIETKLTLIKLTSALNKSGAKELRLFTTDKLQISKQELEDVIGFLLFQNYLKVDKGYTMYTTVAYLAKGDQVVMDGIISMPYPSALRGFKVVGMLENEVEIEPPLEQPMKKRRK